MLVLDPNITNSWNRQITTRFFLISCIKSAKDSLTFKRTVARTFTDFNDLFSIVFLIPAPECDSALTFLCVWAVRRSSRSREKGTRGCWEPPVDPLNQRGDDKQQQHQHHQHHFSASTWPLQLLTRHSLSANRPDVFFFYPLFFTSCWEVSLCCFFFFSGGVAAGVCFQPDCIRIKPAEFLVSHQQGHTEREEEAVEEIMEILDSSEPFLHWDRNLSELSEAGEIDCALYTNVSYRSGMCGWLIRAWWLTLEPIRGI